MFAVIAVLPIKILSISPHKSFFAYRVKNFYTDFIKNISNQASVKLLLTTSIFTKYFCEKEKST